MRHLLRFASLSALVSLVACGGSVAQGTSGSSLSGSNGSGSNEACASEEDRAATYLAAKASGWSDPSCAVDSDCVVVDAEPRCVESCGDPTLVSQAGAAALASALATVNATICTSACPVGSALPCVAPDPASKGGPSCVNGTCAYYPVSAWLSVTLLEADSDPPTSCTTNTSCTTWVITPDGEIAVNGVTTSLSAADFATVDGLLRSAPLRTSPPVCPSVSGADHIGFSITRPDGSSFSEDAIGCIQSTSANDLKTIYELAKSYDP